MSPGDKRRRISVGIAAYNAGANIGELLCAVTSQRQETSCIEEIIVHSDGSSDRTVEVARTCADPRLLIIDNPHRSGFAASVRTILSVFKGDAIVLLNDDVRIRDRSFVEKCVVPILRGGSDLVSANLQPLPPRSFVEQAFVSIFRVYERVRERMADPDNMLTCDGGALTLSRRLVSAIDFPTDPAQMGNVDAFLFLTCVGAGYRYAYARDAVAWFRSPSTLGDYLRRNIRNDSQERILAERFGPWAHAFFRTPRSLYWKSVALETVRHPLAAAFVFGVGLHIRFKTRHAPASASPTWDVLPSSKELD